MTEPSVMNMSLTHFHYYKEDTVYNPIEEYTHPNITKGDGAIMSTSADVTRFFSRLLGNLTGTMEPHLSTELRAQMVQPEQPHFGMGLIIFPEEEEWEHAGFTDGFASIAIFYMELSMAICVIANSVSPCYQECIKPRVIAAALRNIALRRVIAL